MRPTLPAILAALLTVSPAAAQRLRPFVTLGAGIGSATATCAVGATVCASGGTATIGGALGGGVALGSHLRAGAEFVATSSAGLEVCCTRGDASLATLALTDSAVPGLELRVATGVVHVFGRNGGASPQTLAPHAFAARVGLAYALGHGDNRTLLTIDALRARGHGVDYRSMLFGVSLRYETTPSPPRPSPADARTRDTSLLAVGTRVRARLVGDPHWHVGRLAAASPDVIRMRACVTCEPREYRLADLRALEWSTGHGRNAGFYGTLLGAPTGLLLGALAVTKTYRCGGELCGVGALMLGTVAGAVTGATAGGLVARHWAGERWRPVTLPGSDHR